ncbi:MAG: XdhC family protein [Erythrobacter sp.]|uniref:XdhC family protein n=1 Tax=Erythrobacter sp. TaxID=1042 RepID=UPI003C74A13C
MIADTLAPVAGFDEDHTALRAACEPGVALCTIVGIEGSFSRRLGAQLAVRPDGSVSGSLADGCLERQLAVDVAAMKEPIVRRYGAGSDLIDFRLPCGSGLDILLEPAPDRAKLRAVAHHLDQRQPARLELPACSPLRERTFVPQLAVRAFGEGPELEVLARLAGAMGVRIEKLTRSELSLGRASGLPLCDAWTATVLLFHDHEWELALIEEALESDAFYIGAQGGESARIRRVLELQARGVDETALARLESPIGLIPTCKDPATLALSVLAEIAGRYGALRDAA